MDEEIYLPSLKTVKEEGNEGVFSIEPLNPGYGITLGNALRRVLLSSLEGAAPTSVKIKGVHHEFSTLPGVREDMIELILNLKSLCLISHTKGPVILHLLKKGEGEIKAKDIKTPSEVEITNPQLHIATLDNKNASLEMEIKVEKGRGYLPVEAREGERLEVGDIAIDALFSPVLRVSYNVEPTRVGKVTNLDRLVVEITTDGTISSSQALKEATQLLVNQLSLLLEEKKPKKEKKGKEKAPKILIDELDLSPRTANSLLASDIKDTSKLTKMTKEKLSQIKGLGKIAVDEIKEKLASLNLALKEEKTKVKEQKGVST